ncbi:MAG: PIN domain-containing protein [Cellulomonadaceae bacterium]|jgi:predicted nucleic acid-binding protein|nr:PIN domain-containing protein [Cellulomonadaceae bacterium]
MKSSPHSIVLDSTALAEAAADSPAMYPWLTWARRSDSSIYISAATLAETTDGSPRDARIHRIAKAIEVVPVSSEIGFAAGRLRAIGATTRAKPRDLTVDALVAATACHVRPPAVVLTSDVKDLERILVGTGVLVRAV